MPLTFPEDNFRDVFVRDPQKFLSELGETLGQCAIWQLVSDMLVKQGVSLHSWSHWTATGVSSATPALARGIVDYMRGAPGLDTSMICMDTATSFIAFSIANAEWQPGFDFAETQGGPAEHFLITGIFSGLLYLIVLLMMRYIFGCLSEQYRRERLTTKRFTKDFLTAFFQIFPVASIFVQTNGRYLIEAFMATGSPWLDAARAAACGAIGYVGGYAIRCLIYFLRYALPYVFGGIGGFSKWLYTKLRECLCNPRGYQRLRSDSISDIYA